MPNKRTKVASTSISDGHATLKCYSDPAQGAQRVVDECIYDMRNLNGPTLLNLAAYGFCSVASAHYPHGDAHPNVAQVTRELYNEMVAGNWQPGKRNATGSEPTDLMKAVAEATDTPVHVVQHEFETRMILHNDGTLYKDKAGKPRRFFSASVQAEIAADPAIAPILARLEQERAKATLAAVKSSKQPSKLASLFTMPPAVDTPSDAEAA